jgi:hypothetical protein
MPQNREFTIDLSHWDGQALIDWQAAAGAADWKALSNIMSECITRWPYMLSPKDPRSYVKLTPLQRYHAANAVYTAIEQYLLPAFRQQIDMLRKKTFKH